MERRLVALALVDESRGIRGGRVVDADHLAQVGTEVSLPLGQRGDVRDGGLCRTPGCNAPVRHYDHVVRASDGGPTSADNGQGLCERCNYVKETWGWSSWVTTAGTGPHEVHGATEHLRIPRSTAPHSRSTTTSLLTRRAPPRPGAHPRLLSESSAPAAGVRPARSVAAVAQAAVTASSVEDHEDEQDRDEDAHDPEEPPVARHRPSLVRRSRADQRPASCRDVRWHLAIRSPSSAPLPTLPGWPPDCTR